MLGSFVLIGAVAVLVHSRRNDEREHCFREAEKLYASALLVQRSFDYDPDLGMFDLTGASFAEMNFRAECPDAVETKQSAKEMLAALLELRTAQSLRKLSADQTTVAEEVRRRRAADGSDASPIHFASDIFPDGPTIDADAVERSAAEHRRQSAAFRASAAARLKRVPGLLRAGD